MAEPPSARSFGIMAESGTHDAADSILSRGYLSTQPQNRSVLTGTRRLMFAVLQNGIDTYLRGKGGEQSEAEDWVRSRRRESPFSFTVLCEEFSLDPSAVRTVLEELREASAPGGPIRVRPYSRGANQIAASTKRSVRRPRTRSHRRCARP